MDIRETVSVAIDALRSNKLRAILTSLGVIIGSASIVLVVTVPASGLSIFATGAASAAYACGAAVRQTSVESKNKPCFADLNVAAALLIAPS